MKRVKVGIGVWDSKAECENGVGSWWAYEASSESVMVGKKVLTFLRKVNPRSVYCCWQGRGKMSGALENITRDINTSPGISSDQLEVIKVHISVLCSLYIQIILERSVCCLYVNHLSGRARVGLLWKSPSAAGHRGDQKPEKICSLC